MNLEQLKEEMANEAQLEKEAPHYGELAAKVKDSLERITELGRSAGQYRYQHTRDPLPALNVNLGEYSDPQLGSVMLVALVYKGHGDDPRDQYYGQDFYGVSVSYRVDGESTNLGEGEEITEGALIDVIRYDSWHRGRNKGSALRERFELIVRLSETVDMLEAAIANPELNPQLAEHLQPQEA